MPPFVRAVEATFVVAVLACSSAMTAAAEPATARWSTPLLSIVEPDNVGDISDLAVLPGGDFVVVGDETQYRAGPISSFVIGVSRSGDLLFRLELGTVYNLGQAKVAVGAEGQIWVAGSFPSLARPGEPTPSLLELSADGSAVIRQFASEGLWLQRVAVDGSGAVYVSGVRDDARIVVAKLVGLVEVYEAVLDDFLSIDVGGLAVDQYGRATIVGTANAADHDGVAFAHPQFDGMISGSSDGFLVRLSADGAKFEVARYVGGSGSDQFERVVLDAAGRIFVQGYTTSADLPAVEGSYPLEPGRNAIVAVLESDGRLRGPVLRLPDQFVFQLALTGAGLEVGFGGDSGANLDVLSPDELRVLQHFDLASSVHVHCLSSGALVDDEDLLFALIHPAPDQVFDLRRKADWTQDGPTSDLVLPMRWSLESVELHASPPPDPLAPPPTIAWPKCHAPPPSSTTTGGTFHGPGGAPIQGEGCANLRATGESRWVIAGAVLLAVALRRRRRPV
jgi:hypothetical protein